MMRSFARTLAVSAAVALPISVTVALIITLMAHRQSSRFSSDLPANELHCVYLGQGQLEQFTPGGKVTRSLTVRSVTEWKWEWDFTSSEFHLYPPQRWVNPSIHAVLTSGRTLNLPSDGKWFFLLSRPQMRLEQQLYDISWWV
jgi:hypothetical protein